MKSFKDVFIIVLLVVLIPYLLTSLIQWSFVTLNWSNFARVVLGAMYVFGIPASIVFYYEHEEKEK